MYKALIVEDEHLAADRLKNLITQFDRGISVVELCDSIESTVSFLQQHGLPDLIFMDIQLADGLSFSIFDKTSITCPVIFTTAYEEYAIKAFKVNSVDYLLKPIDEKELYKAIVKFEKFFNKTENGLNSDVLQTVQSMLQGNNTKTRFLIKVGQHLKSINIQDIFYFYSLDKATYICTNKGRHYSIDQSLDKIQSDISKDFFRINRSFIVSHNAIKDIVMYSNSRLKLSLEFCGDTNVLVSREKVGEFKNWLEN